MAAGLFCLVIYHAQFLLRLRGGADGLSTNSTNVHEKATTNLH